MATCFDNLNGKKLVIGLVHLLPMLGTPLYEGGNMEKMIRKAIEDCKTLKANGADGGLIQTVDVYYPSTDDTDYARVAGWRQSPPGFVKRLDLTSCWVPRSCGTASRPLWRCAKLPGLISPAAPRWQAIPNPCMV